MKSSRKDVCFGVVVPSEIAGTYVVSSRESSLADKKSCVRKPVTSKRSSLSLFFFLASYLKYRPLLIYA
jgi:hypothetical protein